MTFGVVIAVATVSWLLLLAWLVGWWLGHDDEGD